MGIFGGSSNVQKNLEKIYKKAKNMTNSNSSKRQKQKALQYLEEAAQGGLMDAMSDLIELYYTGKYCFAWFCKDYDRAVYWMKRYLNSLEDKPKKHWRYGEISYWLSMCYCDGNGVPKDRKQELAWLERGAAAGYAKAAALLGGIYYLESRAEQFGCVQDYAAAAHWYVVAFNNMKGLMRDSDRIEILERVQSLARRKEPEALEAARKYNEKQRMYLEALRTLQEYDEEPSEEESEKGENIVLMTDWLGQAY